MSTAGLKGINAAGHDGWITVKCRVCARILDLTEDITYVCRYCETKYDAYFCPADAKRLRYRCPYCGRELTLYNPWLVEVRR